MPPLKVWKYRGKCPNGLTGVLLLQNGFAFVGCGFGAEGVRVGEVVFTTGMVGYHEALTDPSYKGQILVFTHPLIGNYGVPPYTALDELSGLPKYFESIGVKVEGVVVSNATSPSHRLAALSLDEWLRKEGVPGVHRVDTRLITTIIRSHGVVKGLIAVSREAPDLDELWAKLLDSPSYDSTDFVKLVAPKNVAIHEPRNGRAKATIVVVDCGVKFGILRALIKRGFRVVRVPPWLDPQRFIDEYRASGVVISNGPGNPSLLDYAIKSTAAVLELGIPCLGICLGNQLIALASGGAIYKLRYGHRGHNKPCIDLDTGRCYVTSQNHGYAVDAKSLSGTGLRVWFVNADDGSVEGLKHVSKPVIATQFHPEASPGPRDTEWVFDLFAREVERHGATP